MACSKIEHPWGLAIVTSAFFIQFLTFGISMSFGVYIVELLVHFEDVSLALISLIGSINLGLFLGAGPLVSLLMRKLSYRKVCLLGSLLSSVGLLALPFTPNIPYLLLFYGIVNGIGCCLLYIPSHTMSGLYYDKRRSLATGIATSGSALGGVLFPNLIQYLIEEYGWRGSFLIVTGLTMNTFVFSALLRESPVQRKQKLEIKNLKLQSFKNNEKLLNGEHKNLLLDEESTPESKSMESKPLYKDLPFVIYFFNNVLWNIGGAIPIVLGPEYFKRIKFSEKDAASLVSMYSFGSFFGCILGGVIGNLPRVNRLALYISVNFIIVCFGILMPMEFVHTFILLAIINICWGLFFGFILGLLVVVTADLVGAPSLGDAMGSLMLANGLGCVTGPPIGGWLQEMTGVPESAFYYSIAVIFTSALLMLVIPLRNWLCSKHATKNDLTIQVNDHDSP